MTPPGKPENSERTPSNCFAPISFSTEDLPERDRAAVWREVIGRNVVRLDLEPLSERPLRSVVAVHALPGLAMMSGDISEHKIARTRELITDGNSDFRLEIRLRGREHMSQRGREVVLDEGEAALVSCAEEVVALQSPGLFLGLHIPRADLTALVPQVENAVMRRIPRDVPSLRLLVNYVRFLSMQRDLSTPELQRSAASHIRELVAQAVAAHSGLAISAAQSAVAGAAPLSAIEAEIAANHARADLNPAAITIRRSLQPRSVPLPLRHSRKTAQECSTVSDNLRPTFRGEFATLAIGPFRLDVESETLYCGNEPLSLGRRAVVLLIALAGQHGRIVSKDELIQAAWPGLAVEESNLTVQIAALRRALSSAAGADQWIKTMPRRGYRFVGPAVRSADPEFVRIRSDQSVIEDLQAVERESMFRAE